MSHFNLTFFRGLLTRLLPEVTLVVYLLVTTLGAFTGGLWGIVGIAGGLTFYIATWIIERKLPRPDKDLLFLTALTLSVIALLNLLSPLPDVSWFNWRNMLTILTPMCLYFCPTVLARAQNRKLFATLPVMAGIGAVALGVELLAGGYLLNLVKGGHASTQQYNRGFSYLVILTFPIVAGMAALAEDQKLSFKARYLWPALFPLIFLFPAGLTESRAAKVALIFGIGATVLAFLWPVVVRYVLGLLPVLFIGWPFAAQEIFRSHYAWLSRLPDSWRARMEIWDYMSYRIMEKPWLGWGMGTSSSLDFKNPDGARYVITTAAASHPHNALIQVWVELGVPGLALGLAFAWLTLQKCASLPERLTPYALGAWAASLSICMVAYSLWTDSLFAAFALTGFAFALLAVKPKSA